MTSLRRLSISCLSPILAALLSSTALAAPPDADDADDAEAAPDADEAAADTDEAAPEDDSDAAPSDAAQEPAEPEATETEAADDAAPAPDEVADEVAHEQPIADPEGPLEGQHEQPAPKAPLAIGDKHSVTYSSLLAPRINPLGLEERLWIGYQYRLYDKDKAILNGSNVGIFFRPVVSPAIALIGATLQFQPAAVFRLRATYSFIQWFGTFQYMQSYQSPYDDWSETRLDTQAEAGENYLVNGHQVELEALVQIKVKNLAIRSTTFGYYNHYNLRGDDDLFYAVRFDIMAPGKGWMLSNDSDVLWLQPMKGPRNATLIAGARASTVMAFYTDEVYEEGDVIDNPNGPQFRLGPMIGYTFFNRPERRFNNPTLLVIPQWNIKHRFRTGRDVSTAFPTIIMAFAFSGQLWGRS